MIKKKKLFNWKVNINLYLCVALFLIIFINQDFSFAQTGDEKKELTYGESQQKILENQARIKEKIEKLKAVELKVEGRPEVASSLLEQKLEILKKIDLVYEQQLSQNKRSLDLKQTLSQQRDELSNLLAQKVSSKAAYPFLFLDELKEKLVLLEGQEKTIEKTIKDAEKSLQVVQGKWKSADQNLRRVKEQLEAKKKGGITSPDYILAELESRLADEEVYLREKNLKNEKLEKDLYQLRHKILRQKISLVEPNVQFTKKELREQIFEVEKDEIKLKNSLERAKTKEELAHSRWLNAKKQLDEMVSPSEAEKKEENVLTWKARSDTYHLEVETLSQCLRNLDDLKKIWQYRYALFHKTELVDLVSWRKEVEQALEQLERERRLQVAHQTECLNEILSLEKKLQSIRGTEGITWFIEEQLKAFRDQEDLFKKGLENVQSTQSAYHKLLSEIESKEKQRGIKEKLSAFLVILYQVWEYEITSLEDHPITVGKIIVALILLAVGFLISHLITTQIGKQLIRRFGLDESAAFACQRMLHYLLLLLIVLFVLYLVRIPLTFFTVVGGALAIGVGFGSQNIVNNFLSGLVLMVERPLKIGDIVEVENVRGTVELVGTRSTRIKTFDNLHLVVPNSTLLQNKVINWRLSDDIVRRAIVVGVQYGSPVRKVESLIQQAVCEHNLVEKYPKPIVLFDDFGDNALIFTVLIWVRISTVAKTHLYIRQVESDIRFYIDELFRQNNIVIAFPQRDIHLDTLKPLEVKVRHTEG